MGKFALKVELTRTELKTIRERYHFSAKDEKRLEEMYRLLLSFVRAEGYFRVCDKKEIAGILYENYVIVLVTLSEYVDRLIELESNAGNLLEAYMIDCIALEMLNKAYQQMADEIYKETGFWQGKYEFPGNEIPLEQLAPLLERFSESSVHLNKAGMMMPEKSVLYVSKLTKERKESLCNVCESCRNQACQNRRKGISV